MIAHPDYLMYCVYMAEGNIASHGPGIGIIADSHQEQRQLSHRFEVASPSLLCCHCLFTANQTELWHCLLRARFQLRSCDFSKIYRIWYCFSKFSDISFEVIWAPANNYSMCPIFTVRNHRPCACSHWYSLGFLWVLQGLQGLALPDNNKIKHPVSKVKYYTHCSSGAFGCFRGCACVITPIKTTYPQSWFTVLPVYSFNAGGTLWY